MKLFLFYLAKSVLVFSIFSSAASSAQVCKEQIIPTTPDIRFELSDDEVTDLKTGLIWRRCSEGQAWDGESCSGNAIEYTWSDALSEAESSADWRLPSIKELSTIVEMACSTPALNSNIFPNSDLRYWSSSPYAGETATGENYSVWYLSLFSGATGSLPSDWKLSIRLVRGGSE